MTFLPQYRALKLIYYGDCLIIIIYFGTLYNRSLETGCLMNINYSFLGIYMILDTSLRSKEQSILMYLYHSRNSFTIVEIALYSCDKRSLRGGWLYLIELCGQNDWSRGKTRLLSLSYQCIPVGNICVKPNTAVDPVMLYKSEAGQQRHRITISDKDGNRWIYFIKRIFGRPFEGLQTVAQDFNNKWPNFDYRGTWHCALTSFGGALVQVFIHCSPYTPSPQCTTCSYSTAILKWIL